MVPPSQIPYMYVCVCACIYICIKTPVEIWSKNDVWNTFHEGRNKGPTWLKYEQYGLAIWFGKVFKNCIAGK